MKIGYDTTPKYDIPAGVVEAIETIGRELCLAQQKAAPESAFCWNVFAWMIDDNLQIHYQYAGSECDLSADEDWKIVRVSDIPPPKLKPQRKRSF